MPRNTGIQEIQRLTQRGFGGNPWLADDLWRQWRYRSSLRRLDLQRGPERLEPRFAFGASPAGPGDAQRLHDRRVLHAGVWREILGWQVGPWGMEEGR
jgi:hypothetical protein